MSLTGNRFFISVSESGGHVFPGPYVYFYSYVIAEVMQLNASVTLTIVPVIGATAPPLGEEECDADTNFGDGLLTWNVPS